MKHVALYVKVKDKKAAVERLLSFSNDHENWSCVHTYVDYEELIADALSGMIDIIVTESVAKFGEGRKGFAKDMRTLREHGVEVYFFKEGIYSNDPVFYDALAAFERTIE